MPSLLVLIPLTPADPTSSLDVLADLGGRPLLAWSLDSAAEAGATARMAVVGADNQALSWARAWGAETIDVPPLAPPARLEDTALFALDRLAAAGSLPPWVGLLNPSLPLRRPGRLETAWARLHRAGAASLMSVCEEAPRFWCQSPGGLIPLYDHQEHGRRPGREPWLRENGSLYLAARDGLERHRQRLFGRIATLEMDWAESVRADDPVGLAVCRALLAHVRPETAAATVAATAEAR